MQLITTRNLRTMPRLNPYAPKYAFLRTVLRFASHLSDGVALGFAQGFDSGLMLDYVYQNQSGGTGSLGRWLDRIFLNQPGWQASRKRKEVLQHRLRDLLLMRRTQGLPTNVLDIAAGPGRYHLELLADLGGEDIRLICRDSDPAALAYGERLATELWLADRVRYELGDATSPQELATVSPTPHIVVVSGLYEILNDDAAVCQSLLGIRAILPDDGMLLFTAQVNHPQLELIANVLTNRRGKPWLMGTRPLSRMERWAREAGFSQVSSELEPHGLFSITQCVV